MLTSQLVPQGPAVFSVMALQLVPQGPAVFPVTTSRLVPKRLAACWPVQLVHKGLGPETRASAVSSRTKEMIPPLAQSQSSYGLRSVTPLGRRYLQITAQRASRIAPGL